jgi:hypothetical protein
MFTPLTKQQYENAIKTGFTPQQIIEMEKKRKAINTPEQKEPNYFERVWSEYEKAGQDIVSGIQKGAEQGQQGLNQGGVKGALNVVGGLLRGGLRTVGGVAGATFAPITEAPIIKPTLETIGTGISKIPGVSNVIQKGTELASKYPEVAKDIKNVVDIGVLGVGKPVGAGTEKTGIAIERAGTKAIDVAKNKFAAGLIKPIETKATKLLQVARTTEAGGIFKKDIVTPTVMEENMAKEVAQIQGISSKNTFQKNFNLIRDYNVQQAKQLEADIKAYDFAIPRKETIARLNEAANELKNSPLIVGDSAKTAQRLISGAKNIIDKNAGTGSGLLKTRKEYDAWVLSQKPKVFDATADNAFTIANDTVRKTLNNLLDEKATNLGIKDSLKKQSTLYGAMENVGPKAAEEANTVFGRTMQRIGTTLGTRNKLVQMIAAATGVGVFGAATAYAMPLTIGTGIGFLLYKGGKLIMKPQVRILLGRLLKESGGLINTVDRAVIQELLTNYPSENEPK